MSREALKTISANGPFGAIQPGFSFDLRSGYMALVGANNSGKSTVLQWIARDLLSDPQFGVEQVCYIEAERGYISPTTEVQNQTLSYYNDALRQALGSQPLSFSAYRSPFPGDLTKYLLNHKNFRRQLDGIDKLLTRLGMPAMDLQGSQTLYFEEVLAAFQGSGLRSMLPILAALSDPAIRVLLVDEPETSLEPALAKRLRALLVEDAGNRAIVVATHSYLFVDRSDLTANAVVDHAGGPVRVTPIKGKIGLVDLVFRLLGSSTEDLLLPANFIIVEGGSDQIIVEKALLLEGSPPGRIKVFAGQGVDDVPVAVAAVQTVRPLLLGDGPYARTVAALVDQPTNREQRKRVDALKLRMTDRLVELDAPSIEEYIPDDLFERAGMVKADQLKLIVSLKKDYAELAALKTSIASRIANEMVQADLAGISLIRDVANLAIAAADK